MKGKMAIIGDGDSALAFVAGGVDAYSATDAESAEKLIKKLAKQYQIIFITDVLASKVDEIIQRYTSSTYPIILPVPSKDGSSGYGVEKIKKAMDRALGVDILFNNEK